MGVGGAGQVTVKLSGGAEVAGSHLLVATGRRPNTDDLGLEQAGVPVQELLSSMLGSMFEGENNAVFVRTALGVVEIAVLPGAMEAEQISITYTRNASTVVPHRYVLKGPRLRSEGELMDVAYPMYFTLHQNWFIMTDEPHLDDVLKHALKQTNRPLK